MTDDEALRHAALTAPGDTTPALREATQAAVRATVVGDEAPSLEPAVARYVTAIEEAAHAISDEAFDDLRRAGLSEAAIFEVTVNAAVSAGLVRLELARQALEAST